MSVSTAAPRARSRALPLSALLAHRGILIGGTIILFFVLLAILAPWLTDYSPYAPDIKARLKPPFWDEGTVAGHPLGTDQLGRDYLTRLLYGARISLVIGLFAVAISSVIGITLGLIAGYFGGKVDAFISFIITTRLSMPVILIALAVVAIAGGSLTTVILVIGFLIWDQFAVVARSATQQVRSAEYVRSAEALGCSLPHILLREILPNIAPALIVVATVELANAILLEAALSFLGLGVQAPLPSWGLMLSEAKNFMFFDPWLITLPGVCLFVLTIAINLAGDGLRDVTRGVRR
ncbi:ABC transporter permease [Acuticoccus kandeliae]|uniref:ABC transporter permease n=1 Tax=Acuticoccus kandeliae TaxID=2073160 RepID=UPI000D3E6E0C|nr:ABC transporter permease [Acuticoccus kandeliae]